MKLTFWLLSAIIAFLGTLNWMAFLLFWTSNLTVFEFENGLFLGCGIGVAAIVFCISKIEDILDKRYDK